MFRTALTLASIVALAGCSRFGPPCEKAYKAVDRCVEEYSGEENASGDFESFCAEEDECMDDYYDCMATTYQKADCSTSEGVSEAGGEAATCVTTADMSQCETASGTADSGGSED